MGTVSQTKHKYPPQHFGHLCMSAPTVSVPPSVNSNDAPVKWSLNHKKTVINHLVENRSQAGDGSNFKNSAWSAISPILKAQRTEGEDSQEM